jgi:TolA-binding protein
MAKQRRPLTSRQTKTRVAAASTHAAGSVSPTMSAGANQPPQPPPTRRSTYFEAVAVYERGLEALQRHDFQVAADLFESVLRQYPEEKEPAAVPEHRQRQAAPRGGATHPFEA